MKLKFQEFLNKTKYLSQYLSITTTWISTEYQQIVYLCYYLSIGMSDLVPQLFLNYDLCFSVWILVRVSISMLMLNIWNDIRQSKGILQILRPLHKIT